MFRAAYSSSLNKSFRCQHTQGQGLPEVMSRPSSEVTFVALLRIAANIFPFAQKTCNLDIKCNLYIMKRPNLNVFDFENICFKLAGTQSDTKGACSRDIFLSFKICFVSNSGLVVTQVNLCFFVVSTYCYIYFILHCGSVQQLHYSLT